jgi:hypothetical protein
MTKGSETRTTKPPSHSFAAVDCAWPEGISASDEDEPPLMFEKNLAVGCFSVASSDKRTKGGETQATKPPIRHSFAAVNRVGMRRIKPPYPSFLRRGGSCGMAEKESLPAMIG